MSKQKAKQTSDSSSESSSGSESERVKSAKKKASKPAPKKSKRSSNSSSDSSSTKRSKVDSEQAWKIHQLNDRLDKLKTALITKQGELDDEADTKKCTRLKREIAQFNNDITKNEALHEKLMLQPTTSTKDNSASIAACDNMKVLVEAMQSVEMNEVGIIDLKGKVVDAQERPLYEEAEIILERQCYKNSLQYITDKDKNAKPRITYVGGTPGVGKTSFRFYLLWLWVNKKDGWLNNFESVHFSHCKHIYTITRDDREFSVSRSTEKEIFDSGNPNLGLGLIEAPAKLEALEHQLYGMAALIMTVSPGRLGAGTEISKVVSSKTYITLWDMNEAIKLVQFGIFGDEGKQQLNERFPLYGGVLRLLAHSDPEELVKTVLTQVTIEFIREVLERETPKGKSAFVHRLVALGKDGEIIGFISNVVLKKCLYSLKRSKTDEMRGLLKVVGKGEMGFIFEAMVCGDLTRDAKETGKCHLVLADKTTIKVGRDYLTYNANSKPAETGRLYKPWNQNFHGLDFFVLQAGIGNHKQTLYMLQTTISSSHKELSFSNTEITTLIRNLGGVSAIGKIVIVYVLPEKNEKFNPPEPINAMTEVQKNATSVVGWPDPKIEGFDYSDDAEVSVDL